MSIGGKEPSEGAEYLVTDGKYNGMVGRQSTGPRDVFKGSVSGGPPIWVVYVGDDSPHGQVPGGVSAQSRQADYRETSEAMDGW